MPCSYDGFALFGKDALDGPAISRPGAPCPDAPVGDGFLLDRLSGGFTVLAVGGTAPEPASAEGITAKVAHIATPSPELKIRYLGDANQAIYLIRPDQHVVARWPDYDAAAIASAIKTAIGKGA